MDGGLRLVTTITVIYNRMGWRARRPRSQNDLQFYVAMVWVYKNGQPLTGPFRLQDEAAGCRPYVSIGRWFFGSVGVSPANPAAQCSDGLGL